MASRTVLDCDSCGTEGAETFGPMDLGTGSRTVDLCPGCQDVVGLPKLRMLLDDYGADATGQARQGGRTPASARARRCPICGDEYVSRQAAIAHCETRHGMTNVEASHAVRPDGPAEECPTCGYLLAKGGAARHSGLHK